MNHNCFDHLEYDSHEWVEPHGEHCTDEWYRCTICFRVYTIPEADRMWEANLGDAIKETRKILGGISQERFARRLGTTTRTIARWEASESLSASILSRLRDVAIAAKAYHAAQIFQQKLGEMFEPEAEPK